MPMAAAPMTATSTNRTAYSAALDCLSQSGDATASTSATAAKTVVVRQPKTDDAASGATAKSTTSTTESAPVSTSADSTLASQIEANVAAIRRSRLRGIARPPSAGEPKATDHAAVRAMR
jgi:hypothetical protein